MPWSDEARFGPQLLRKMMEHQHPPTQPVGADPIGREGISPHRPIELGLDGSMGQNPPLLVRLLIPVMTLAVVEDNLEHPSRRIKVVGLEMGPFKIEEERHAVAVANPF